MRKREQASKKTEAYKVAAEIRLSAEINAEAAEKKELAKEEIWKTERKKAVADRKERLEAEKKAAQLRDQGKSNAKLQEILAKDKSQQLKERKLKTVVQEEKNPDFESFVRELQKTCPKSTITDQVDWLRMGMPITGPVAVLVYASIFRATREIPIADYPSEIALKLFANQIVSSDPRKVRRSSRVFNDIGEEINELKQKQNKFLWDGTLVDDRLAGKDCQKASQGLSRWGQKCILPACKDERFQMNKHCTLDIFKRLRSGNLNFATVLDYSSLEELPDGIPIALTKGNGVELARSRIPASLLQAAASSKDHSLYTTFVEFADLKTGQSLFRVKIQVKIEPLLKEDASLRGFLKDLSPQELKSLVPETDPANMKNPPVAKQPYIIALDHAALKERQYPAYARIWCLGKFTGTQRERNQKHQVEMDPISISRRSTMEKGTSRKIAGIYYLRFGARCTKAQSSFQVELWDGGEMKSATDTVSLLRAGRQVVELNSIVGKNLIKDTVSIRVFSAEKEVCWKEMGPIDTRYCDDNEEAGEDDNAKTELWGPFFSDPLPSFKG